MWLAIPSIIVSDFHTNRSRFIGVNMWFKCFSLPLQVFRPYFVVFLALGMFYFCKILCKPYVMVCSVSQTMSLIRNINMDKSVTMFLQTKCINCRVVYVYWKPVIFFTLITIPSHPLALCNLAYPPPFRPPRNIYMTLTSLFISQCMGVNLSWPEKIKAQHNKPWEMKGRWKRPTKKSWYFCLGGAWHNNLPAKKANEGLKVEEFNQKRFQE